MLWCIQPKEMVYLHACPFLSDPFVCTSFIRLHIHIYSFGWSGRLGRADIRRTEYRRRIFKQIIYAHTHSHIFLIYTNVHMQTLTMSSWNKCTCDRLTPFHSYFVFLDLNFCLLHTHLTHSHTSSSSSFSFLLFCHRHFIFLLASIWASSLPCSFTCPICSLALLSF